MKLCVIIFLIFSITSCGGSNTESTKTRLSLQLSSSTMSVNAGEPFTITAKINNSGGKSLNYQWQQKLGADVELASDATTTLTVIAPNVISTETLTIELTITDSDGASFQESISLQIKNGLNVSLEYSDGEGREGEKVEVSSIVTGENIENLTYLWKQTDGPVLDFSDVTLSSLSFIIPNIPNNTQAIVSLQVTNSVGHISYASINIFLSDEEAVPPKIYFRSEDNYLMSLEQAYFSVESTYPEGSTVSYQWQQITGPDLIFEDQGADNLLITAPEVSTAQNATFKVTAKDTYGVSDEVILSIHVFPHYQVTTLQGSTDGKGVDLVVLAEGFTQAELPQFEAAVTELIQAFNQQETIKIHQHAWNIHRIDSISEQSGADFPYQEIYVDTIFNSYYQCEGINRAICLDELKVLGVAASITPQFDQLLVIVNSDTRGGSGGKVPVVAYGHDYINVLIHELGHSFAGLGDEYESSSGGEPITSPNEPNEPNITTITNPEEVKWRHWFENIDDIPTENGQTGVGLFEGAFHQSEGYYRPLYTTFMRDSQQQSFGSVNAEAWALSVYAAAGSIISVEPDEESTIHVAGTPLTFTINPIQPTENNTITWLVNDVVQASDVDKPTQLTLNTPPSTSYSVKVDIIDNSGLIRKDIYQQAQASYTWSVTAQ